jgi:hypothetical protein
MNTIDEAYIGLDLHASTSTFGVIDLAGNQHKRERLPTDPAAMSDWLQKLPATRKYLAVEEGPLTQWMGWQLAEAVDELVVCDPKQNHWISRAARKGDGIDTLKLARLLRLGELAPVWHPAGKNKRALFAAAAAHYLAMRRHQVRLKQQIKALFRRWGVLRVEGTALYSPQGRQEYLARLEDEQLRRQLRSYYAMMDQAEVAQQRAWDQLQQTGKGYPEITEFGKVPGMGPIGSHLFDALVQTPHRFAGAAKLWSWSGLAVTDRSSSGKPLGYERLDRSGRSEIKDISYRAWKAGAMQPNESNEVKDFYEASLKRTGNPTHARLNTQRKILKVLWTIWRNQRIYNPLRF